MPNQLRRIIAFFFLGCFGVLAASSERKTIAGWVDVSGHLNTSRVRCRMVEGDVEIRWPLRASSPIDGYLRLTANDQLPPIRQIGFARGDQVTALLCDQEPAFFVTVGTRQVPPGKPAWQKWLTFFDNPAQRPHETYRMRWLGRKMKVTGEADRVEVVLGQCQAGPFEGELVLRVFADADLVQVQAVLTTVEDDRAILYDAALVGSTQGCRSLFWKDTQEQWNRQACTGQSRARAVAVRGRTIIAEAENGCLAFFPPPHQYFFPRDLTTNLRYVWFGTGYADLEPRHGIGIRTEKTGGGNWVPWFNAPPGTKQRLSMFLLISDAPAEETWQRVLRYTHHDRFPRLAGHVTFTSHYHFAMAVSQMQAQREGRGGRVPEFVPIFKNMGVDIVHLAEFHGDGHPQDPGPLRLPELEMMFAECQRLSDDQLLLLPGEEANQHLGIAAPGKHPGHWMCLFPRPVYWTMVRSAEQPFLESHPHFGRVYHVGNRQEMMRLLQEEHGLAWVAHPRIKASSWTPDIFRDEDFFVADYFLGAAWKAMPADLSDDRLGRRALDLLDDMCNWGRRKYVLGEVDVFKIDHTHELYGHMNINYLQLERVPKYTESWQPILDTLQRGKFFVTTGEVLIEKFSVNGKSSGEEVVLNEDRSAQCELVVTWTFPPAFIELISGDGQHVFRQRLSCSSYPAFSRTELRISVDLTGRTWVRAEAWDVAINGAFTQPIWITHPPKEK